MLCYVTLCVHGCMHVNVLRRNMEKGYVHADLHQLGAQLVDLTKYQKNIPAGKGHACCSKCMKSCGLVLLPVERRFVAFHTASLEQS